MNIFAKLPKMNLWILVFFLSFLDMPSCLADVIYDNSLGQKNSSLNKTHLDQRKLISIPTGVRRGNNLFHSFQEFSLKAGEAARFQSLPGIRHIFSRVTGKKASSINGTVEVFEGLNVSSSNLVFLNTNGIRFGRQAKLNSLGSFLFSTASRIDFDRGQYFSIDSFNLDPAQTNNPILKLSFDNQFSSSINVNSDDLLQSNSSEGQTIALIGRGLYLRRTDIRRPGGHIELGSLDSNAKVTINTKPDRWSFKYDNPELTQPIRLSDTFLFAKGSNPTSGRIHLRGSQIRLNDASRISAENKIGIENTGFINIDATQDLVFEEFSAIQSNGFFDTESIDINVKARNLTLNDSKIESVPFLTTRGGTINLNIQDTIQVRGALREFGTITASSSGNNKAGEINVKAKHLNLLDGGRIENSSKEQGDAGTIQIEVTDDIKIQGIGKGISGPINSGIFGAAVNTTIGKAGIIRIQAENLDILDGGKISVESSDSAGNAGQLALIAKNSITINGSNSSISGSNSGIGVGANLNVDTRSLQILNGGSLSVSSDENIGSAGQLKLFADEIYIKGPNSSIRGVNSGLGQGSNVFLEASTLLSLNDGEITVSSLTPAAQAGDIEIKASIIDANNFSKINATTQGPQGNISILGVDLLKLDNDSSIKTDATGKVPGGNINIDAFIVLGNNNSDITATAIDEQGGSILIESMLVPVGFQLGMPSSRSNDISASSNIEGLEGVIDITASIDPIQKLTLLQTPIVSQVNLRQTRCEQSREKQKNSLIINNGISKRDYAFWLQSIDKGSHWIHFNDFLKRDVSNKKQVSVVREEINEANSWRQNKHGSILLFADTKKIKTTSISNCS